MVTTTTITKKKKKVISKLASCFTPVVKCCLLVGGLAAQLHGQDELVAKSAQVIVGTPGRVFQLLQGKRFSVSNVKQLVLDEADKLCQGDFVEPIR